MSPLATLLRLLRDVPPQRRTLLVMLMLAGAATEGLGLFTLVPMLALIDGGAGAAAMVGGPAAGAWASPFGLTPTLPALLALFLALVLLRGIIALTLGKAQVAEQHDAVNRLSRRCFNALLHAEWRWLAQTHSADHRASLLANASFAGSGLALAMNLASGLVLALAAFGVALTLSWQTTVSAIVLGALIILPLSGIRRRAVIQGEQVWLAQRDVHRQVQRSLSALRLIKTHEAQAVEASSFTRAVTAVRTAKMAHVGDELWTRFLFEFSGALLLVLVIGVGVSYWGLSLAVVLPLVLAMARAVPLLTGLHAAWHGWLHAAPSIAQVQALIDEGESHAEPAGEADCAIPLDQAIVLDDVTVRYPDRASAAIAELSCRIPARSVTAITGASGAGKSTLADLIMGMIEPDDGVITVDGAQLTGPNRIRWRRSVAYVQQDPIIFHASIRENLCWAKPSATEAELERALKLAAADFALSLPDGLETLVGDNGVRLSGGERQRLCLARALLREPSLLILDEATSAVDSDSEAAICSALRNLKGAVTCILIGHRSALIAEAEQILELHDGRLVNVRDMAQAAAS